MLLPQVIWPKILSQPQTWVHFPKSNMKHVQKSKFSVKPVISDNHGNKSLAMGTLCAKLPLELSMDIESQATYPQSHQIRVPPSLLQSWSHILQHFTLPCIPRAMLWRDCKLWCHFLLYVNKHWEVEGREVGGREVGGRERGREGGEREGFDKSGKESKSQTVAHAAAKLTC